MCCQGLAHNSHKGTSPLINQWDPQGPNLMPWLWHLPHHLFIVGKPLHYLEVTSTHNELYNTQWANLRSAVQLSTHYNENISDQTKVEGGRSWEVSGSQL